MRYVYIFLHYFSFNYRFVFSKTDADKFYELVEKLNKENREQPLTDELNKHWIKLFSKTCTGDLCPIQAVIGGIAAQEAMKVRYLIINKNLFFRFCVLGSNRKIYANSTIFLF